MLKKNIKSIRNQLIANIGKHRLPNKDSKLWSLMYHRVLPKNDPRYTKEEPGMVVTPETFDMHIQTIKDFFEVISLTEWIERKKAGKPLPKKACTITFDDGWHDNYEFALPIIQKHQVPTTIFSVTENIGTHQKFWPNALSELITENQNNLNTFGWIPNIESIDPNKLSQQELLATIINACKALTDQEIYQHLKNNQSENSNTLPDLMTWQQLSELSNDPLIDIGSHTCNHYRLNNQIDKSTLKREIVESKQTLEERLNKPIKLFCYPNGDYTIEAATLVSQNYLAAVTTQSGINQKDANLHTLKRIGLHNDASSTRVQLEARLSGWG